MFISLRLSSELFSGYFFFQKIFVSKLKKKRLSLHRKYKTFDQVIYITFLSGKTAFAGYGGGVGLKLSEDPATLN